MVVAVVAVVVALWNGGVTFDTFCLVGPLGLTFRMSNLPHPVVDSELLSLVIYLRLTHFLSLLWFVAGVWLPRSWCSNLAT